MTPEHLATMFSQDGLYVLANDKFPGMTSVVLVMGATHENRGRAFMVEPKEELSPDPANWNGIDAYVAGGPFSVQSCKAYETHLKEHQDLKDAVEQARFHLRLLRDSFLKSGFNHVAEAVQISLDTLAGTADQKTA